MTAYPITGAIAPPVTPGYHRRTATTHDRDWALKYLRHANRPAQHRMTRATRRRARSQRSAVPLVLTPTPRPSWVRWVQVAASWVL